MTAPSKPVVVEWDGGEPSREAGWHYKATFHGMDLVDLRFMGRGVAAWLPVARHFNLRETLALTEEAWMHRQAKEEER